MPSAQSLITRVSAALKKVGPMSRTAYLRTTTVSGGDDLIGRAQTTAYVDYLFSPQPFFKQLGHKEAMYLSTATLQLVADDYKFIFPVTQVSAAYFQEADISIALQDGNGVETLKVIYITTAQYQGKDITVTVIGRSIGYADTIVPAPTPLPTVLPLPTYTPILDGGTF